MFIPNKTFHVIKVTMICAIAALIMIIAGQFVLYIKTANENQVAIQTLETRLDTLTTVSQLFDKSSLKKHTITESQITDAVTSITKLETKVTELEESVGLLRTSTEMLVVNECKVMPYYMDKGLLTTCKNKGF